MSIFEMEGQKFALVQLIDDTDVPRPKRFVAYYHFNGWRHALNAGFHFSFSGPHFELHVPGGFIRVGWWDGQGAPSCSRKFGLGSD